MKWELVGDGKELRIATFCFVVMPYTDLLSTNQTSHTPSCSHTLREWATFSRHPKALLAVDCSAADVLYYVAAAAAVCHAVAGYWF